MIARRAVQTTYPCRLAHAGQEVFSRNLLRPACGDHAPVSVGGGGDRDREGQGIRFRWGSNGCPKVRGDGNNLYCVESNEAVCRFSLLELLYYKISQQCMDGSAIIV